MYVCVCNAVTDKQITKAIDSGCRTMRDLRNELGVGACCGRCATCARNVLNEALEKEQAAAPVFSLGGLALGAA